MLVLIAGVMAASLVPSAKMSAAICDVGRAALHDLPDMNGNRRFDSYYGAIPDHTDVLEVCPKLQGMIPAGYPPADADARARAEVHAPIPAAETRPAFIYVIDIPELSPDLKTATVRMGYACTGLCGGARTVRYVRTRKGWQRQGIVGPITVS